MQYDSQLAMLPASMAASTVKPNSEVDTIAKATAKATAETSRTKTKPPTEKEALRAILSPTKVVEKQPPAANFVNPKALQKSQAHLQGQDISNPLTQETSFPRRASWEDMQEYNADNF